ncbi:MAG: excinuclease ABC subunit UvrB [candidate division WOR-3 bacterium]|nr:excinuclease ABC subunit UvrB [candidate division WOR-3 bacterium]
MLAHFNLLSDFKPTGDQPEAIEKLVKGFQEGRKHQTLLGVTGSGKTFTMANVIQKVGLPTLVLSHNKTLAAQLYGEFKQFFPDNAVEYFVSYYDYYQPEAYVPETDTYIEKDASINEEIDRLRMRATTSLLERRDVIVVASVSCIYGLGSPSDFSKQAIKISKGMEISRDELLKALVNDQYKRNDIEFKQGNFRVKGDVIDIFPSYEFEGIRVEFFGDEIDEIYTIDPISAKKIWEFPEVYIYPAHHFVLPQDRIEYAIQMIQRELEKRVQYFLEREKYLEAQRIESRTKYDIEFLREVGYCSGIENYSRYLSMRKEGEPPYTLIDYFPDEFLTIVDESHRSIPQVRGMYHGDRSRKETLVQYGFRLPSALDNRPLNFKEFLEKIDNVTYVSATPGEWEIEKSGGRVVEQLIRPTGIVDSPIEICPTHNQIDNLIEEIREQVEKDQRVLVTTLTKKMAEELTEYLIDVGLNVRYIHSEVDSIDRMDLLRGFRLGDFDVLVGINLLREGLDLPEVSVVAILDADKAGFLRSEISIIQTAGRAARNIKGRVILYADYETEAIKKALKEIERRRKIQLEYNKKHNITPKSIKKSREQILKTTAVAGSKEKEKELKLQFNIPEEFSSEMERIEAVEKLTKKMKESAERLEFEKAAKLRDEIGRIMREQIKERKGSPFNKKSIKGRHW